MASPLPTGKQSVSLASPGLRGSKSVRGSKIRRDPPPISNEIAVADPDERDARTVVLGILSFTLALLIIAIGVSSFLGWTPRDYVAHL